MSLQSVMLAMMIWSHKYAARLCCSFEILWNQQYSTWNWCVVHEPQSITSTIWNSIMKLTSWWTYLGM